MNKFFSVILILFLGFSVSAQQLEKCGTVGVNEEWEAYKLNNEINTTDRSCDYYIPLSIHVLGDDNGLGYHPITVILESLVTLNKDFEASNITFFIEGPINYINNSSWYEHSSFNVGAQMMNTNNIDNTINCYIVQTAVGACGYRSFAGDAVALAKNCTKANDHTWAHEIGHWLSLNHTFYGWENETYDDSETTPGNIGSQKVELLNGDNCESAADKICDTPPDYLSFIWNCNDNNEFPDSLKDPNGEKFAVDGSLIMSYAADNCQSRFSDNQIGSMCDYIQERVPEVISNVTPLNDISLTDTELIYPIDGEEVIGQVKLKWEEKGSATFYIVEVSRFPNMGILSLREVVKGTELDVFGLTSGKSYYWRIRSANEYDFDIKNNVTEIESFVTGELSSTVDYYSEHLRVYPNPVSQNEYLNLTLDSQTSEDVNITITSIDGRIIYNRGHYIKNGSNNIKLSTQSMSSGIYFLTGIGDLHKFQKKIVIE